MRNSGYSFVDDSMVSEIWNRTAPQLQDLGLLWAERETGEELRVTLVFERESWSPRLFRELRAKRVSRF